MADSQLTQRIFLARRSCRYILPNDLEFVGLAESKGEEIIRIRFSRGRGITLDLPLSAENLAALAYTLGPLRGIEPAELADEIADLQQKGLPTLRD
jgi:hypothetical protein